ncbi:hypothetical protein CABS01_14099 [Colletotrichum abscissum]|uniref:DUF6546 domain-containing protein n=1 Tax=Colletotrichum abscissum TaxID=1671311 RepID=A0A9P9XA79_9PEZI|nr:uncharacterized protein CABS01_14099 [Colletotrichum abscissum]KAI3545692.1 hypothetical protein CABS02_09230 [Colletotrichum abscissum]KAK1482401.1 hypothetical protein CABS01_14099 [Colletotrichum abscissum]
MKLRSKITYSFEYVNNHIRWAILPPEIRLMILEQVEIGYKGHDLSDWASVSREWQAFFEARIFQRLRLRYPGSDIDNLSSFVHGYRRDLVKEILLHVSLDEYDNVNKFDEPETRDTIRTNNKLFSQALKKLFISLSTWSTPKCGVKLRLSASSPSDSGHPWDHRAEASQHDRRRIYSSKSKQRLLGNLLNTSSGTLKLAQVPIVRKLFVNQYCYRSMSEALLAKVLGSLCRLRTVSYEPWHAIAQYEQFPRDEAMIMLLDRAAKISTISSVHVWEAQSKLNGSPRFLRMRNDDLVSSAVNASYRLRFLTLCHAVDATDFFRHSSRDIPENTTELSDSLRAWPALTNLALTTCIGDLVTSPSALDRLLLQASRAALRMPLLKKMEIWAPGAREGFILRYHVWRGSPFLTVIATWQLKLSKEALRSWEQVAASCTERGLTCNVRLVKTETTMSDSPYALCHMLALFPQLREWKLLSRL